MQKQSSRQLGGYASFYDTKRSKQRLELRNEIKAQQPKLSHYVLKISIKF